MADTFAIIAMSVILPVHYELVMILIMTLIMAFFIVVIGMMLYNVSLNLAEMIRTKRWIFSEFKSESKFKKIVAFFSVHRKRRHEKFVLAADVNSKIKYDSKAFVFLSSRNKIMNKIHKESINETYVQNVSPLISYMLGITVFLFFM